MPPLALPSRLLLYPHLRLPALMLTRYLFFLSRRPISNSNKHYLRRRISGFRSLADLLDSDEERVLQHSAALLRAMAPQTLRATAEQIELSLLPITHVDLPKDYIVTDQPPPTSFWRNAGTVLLILGPSIGIGDEIISFPLPAWIKAANPQAEISVLTTYDDLWKRVAAIDHVETYHEYLTLVRALRGELGQYDLVVLVDFENPDLHEVISQERKLAKYLELSVGAQVLAAVDNQQRWVYRFRLPSSCFGNFYFGFDYLARKLGFSVSISERFSDIVRRSNKASDGDLCIFVSPFTSKYDPSPLYWSRLLASLIPASAERQVHFVLDPGPNAETRRFASTLCHSAAARASVRASYRVADGSIGQTNSIADIFQELERSHLVICADSFAAHAAAVMGCTTLVIASAGLENWRVPSTTSFYFNAEDPIDDVVAGMQQVLSHFGIVRFQDNRRPPIGEAEHALVNTIDELHRLLEQDTKGSLDTWREVYTRLAVANTGVLDCLQFWPGAARGLLNDFNYNSSLRAVDEATLIIEPEYGQDLLCYLQNRSLEWSNSNLVKYLIMVIGEMGNGARLHGTRNNPSGPHGA